MDFSIPERAAEICARCDRFIAQYVSPLKEKYPAFFGEDADRLLVTADAMLDPAIPPIRKALRKAAVDAGLYGIHMPESAGGLGLSQLEQVIITEHVTRGEPAPSILWPNLLAYITGEIWGPTPILLRANEALQNEYLPKFMRADVTQAIAMTDPGAGSDPQNMDTKAELKGDTYVLNGEKIYIGNAALAEVLLVFARTSGQRGDHRGLSLILLPASTPGVRIKKMLRPLEGIGNHAHLEFRDCKFPAQNIIGKEGEGLSVALAFLAQGRLRHAATAVGVGSWLLQQCVMRVKERQTFGEPLATRQGLQWELADAALMIEQLRWLTRHAAWAVDQGQKAIAEVAMAKMQGAIVQSKIAGLALQIHGGAGYMADLPFERAFRQARMFALVDGTVEIQRQTIARQLLR